MNRRFMIAGAGLATLAACAPAARRIGPDGLPLPGVYRVSEHDPNEVMFRFLDGLNSLRQAAGAAPVSFDAKLNAAAATHSRDMAVQNRPWHFGSDGSSPLDRGRRVGFTGRILGETISETFESETETLGAWMSEDDTRSVLLDPAATIVGLAWFQEEGGKIWWTFVTGTMTANTMVQG
jgi:uncharacterized protein YkwD